jgi:hypothetical protein
MADRTRRGNCLTGQAIRPSAAQPFAVPSAALDREGLVARPFRH